MTHVERAIGFLVALLHDGPMDSTAVRRAAQTAGIDPRSLYGLEGDLRRPTNPIRRRAQAAANGTSLWWLEQASAPAFPNTCA